MAAKPSPRISEAYRAGIRSWVNQTRVVGPLPACETAEKAGAAEQPVNVYNEASPGRGFCYVDSRIGTLGRSHCHECCRTSVVRTGRARGPLLAPALSSGRLRAIPATVDVGVLTRRRPAAFAAGDLVEVGNARAAVQTVGP